MAVSFNAYVYVYAYMHMHVCIPQIQWNRWQSLSMHMCMFMHTCTCMYVYHRYNGKDGSLFQRKQFWLCVMKALLVERIEMHACMHDVCVYACVWTLRIQCICASKSMWDSYVRINDSWWFLFGKIIYPALLFIHYSCTDKHVMVIVIR